MSGVTIAVLLTVAAVCEAQARAERERDSAKPQAMRAASGKMFQNAFRNVTRERPPRPRLLGTGPFFDGASTPPHEADARTDLTPESDCGMNGGCGWAANGLDLK